LGVPAPAGPTPAGPDRGPPPGAPPGSDPEFAREQLLDEYGLSAAILNNMESLMGGNAPVGLEIELARAANDYNEAWWLASDPRWLAAINVAVDHPDAAVAEIERCRAKSDRYVHVLLNSWTERPQGNPKYWPIYEAAVHHGIPVAFHVGGSNYHASSGAGPGTFYYEMRTAIITSGQAMVSSLIFEGVFDRFPDLKINLVELGWSWLPPLAWRMDASWRVLRDEVAHLQRKPSEYLRDHFWVATQPAPETEHPKQLRQLFGQAERAGLYDRLVFATDYPHWDMDAPFDAVPKSLDEETKRKILGGNAAELYGLELG
jgi:predicted TIM-barrel fold metal-dependent hydrolase